MDDVVVEVAEIRISLDVRRAQTGAQNGAISAGQLNPLLARRHAQNSLSVQARLAVKRLEQVVARVDVNLDGTLLGVSGQHDSEVDGILRVLPADGLAKVVASARCVLEQRAVPHGTSEVAVGGDDVGSSLGTVLVGRDEGGDDVLPGRVVEIVDVLLGSLAGRDGLVPHVADVVRLTRVVPRQEHDEFGLQVEDLRHAVGQGELATAVPVAEAVNVLELVGGEG